MIEECVARITACLNRPGVSIAGLAGLHRNTLDDYDKPGWNPQVQTLDRIMQVVDGIADLERTAKSA
jgi:hypothetical protein